MEHHPGQLCDSEFCQFLGTLDFRSDANAPDVLDDALVRRFPHERAFCEIPIGQIQAIAARKGECPFCTFANAILESSNEEDLTPETICFASLPRVQFRFNLGFKGPTGRTRYIMNNLGEQITFLTSDVVSCYEASRVIDPETVDYARLKSWLHLCQNLHHVCPQITTATGVHRRNLLPQLRVVDTQEMCLTEIPWTDRYVALSYVWGDASPPLLLKNDLRFWHTKNSITDRYHLLPKSIQDAMEVVRRLDLRYFWFDSLCLLQDDPDDLRKSINNMDMIYERAYVTIVAANSPSANGGLPGVARPRTVNQAIQPIKPGLSLTNIAPLDAHLKASRWATRGWTYVLPARTVTGGKSY
jgi:hypothetical protein